MRIGCRTAHISCALCFLLPTALPARAAPPLSEDQRARIGALAGGYLKAAGTPGLTIHVDRGGETIYSAGFGMADLEHNIKAGPESVYAIGSITKSFTAHAVLQLVAEGRLSLDDTVATLLPDYHGPARDVTLRQLLLHTSGIPNYVNDIPSFQPRLRRDALTRADIVGAFAALPLQFRPGTEWSYSNSGYYLLGLVVEKVTGRDYYDYLFNTLLSPLGVSGINSGDDLEIVPNRVRGYEEGPNGLRNSSPWSHLTPFSAGSLMATAADLARYRRAVFTSPAVPAKVRSLMTDAPALVGGVSSGYTLGALIRSDVDGLRKFSHSGEIWGFYAQHAYYPDRDVTIVVLSNRKGTMPTAVSLERQIARVVLGLPEPATRDEAVPADELAHYAGDYVVGPIHLGPPVLGFSARNGKLWMTFGPAVDVASSLPLLALGHGRFALAADTEWVFQFSQPGADGRSQWVTMTALDGTFPATRQQK
jgi:D-alanyl-D-alanine carboxypeptidase